MTPTEATPISVEEFLTSTRLLRRWNAQALTIRIKEVVADAGLHLRRVERRGAVVKLRVFFPPGQTPSLKPKLGHTGWF